METYQQNEEDIKLYNKYMQHRRLTKKELLRLYTMLNPVTEEFDKPMQQFDKLPYMAVILDHCPLRAPPLHCPTANSCGWR